MRFRLPEISLNIALCGIIAPNLVAVALPVSRSSEVQNTSNFQIAQKSIEGVTIQGNGVEFIAPAGFQGGSPSSNDTKQILRATATMFPSLTSFIQGLNRDPAFFRAMAIDTVKSSDNPSLVIVTRLPISADISLASLHETMSRLMPSMLPPEFKLVDSGIISVGSRQIVRLTVSGNIQGIKFQESIGLLKSGNDIFQVTYVFGNNRDRSTAPIFEQIIRSFKTTPQAFNQEPVI